MNNEISREEIIDNYLLGKMSDEERQSFERLLDSDSEFKKDFELQQEIVFAVQRVEMSKFLKQRSANRKQHTNIFVRNIKTISAVCSIAAALVAVVGLWKYQTVAKECIKQSDIMYSELIEPVSRGTSPIDTNIEQIYNYIKDEKFEQAINLITSTNQEITDELFKLNEIQRITVNKEEEYQKQILSIKLQELEWYKTIIYMKDGSVFKAKKQLRRIAGASGIYSEQAKDILNNL